MPVYEMEIPEVINLLRGDPGDFSFGRRHCSVSNEDAMTAVKL